MPNTLAITVDTKECGALLSELQPVSERFDNSACMGYLSPWAFAHGRQGGLRAGAARGMPAADGAPDQ